MNKVRENILSMIKPYSDFYKHKDLIAITIGADYFSYDYVSDEELEVDFSELVVVIEKGWLFELMKENDIEDPLHYLQNEYTWDDSYEWFERASSEGKVVVIEFN